MERLIDRRVEQVSPRKAPVDEVMRLTERVPRAARGVEREALVRVVSEGWWRLQATTRG